MGARFWGGGEGGTHMAAAAVRNFYASLFLPGAGGKRQHGTCGTHKSPTLSHGCGSPWQAPLPPMASRDGAWAGWGHPGHSAIPRDPRSDMASGKIHPPTAVRALTLSLFLPQQLHPAGFLRGWEQEGPWHSLKDGTDNRNPVNPCNCQLDMLSMEHPWGFRELFGAGDPSVC